MILLYSGYYGIQLQFHKVNSSESINILEHILDVRNGNVHFEASKVSTTEETKA